MPRQPTAPAARSDAADKNRPLVEDIRLLGRILGDVIREHEGRSGFELVERVRQLSVAYRLKRDLQAGRALDRLLKNLSSDQTVSVIRAFSYFLAPGESGRGSSLRAATRFTMRAWVMPAATARSQYDHRTQLRKNAHHARPLSPGHAGPTSYISHRC